LLISQLGPTSLLFKQTLSLQREALSTVQFLPIACHALLLVLLPVALPPIVVAIAIPAVASATFPITFPLLATRGVLLTLLLEPASLFPVTCLLRALSALLRLTYLVLSLLLPTLFAFLRLANLFLTLLFWTLLLLILTPNIPALFPALLALLAVLLLLLALLLPTLLLLDPLFASALGRLRWLRRLPLFAAALSLLLSLFSLGPVFLAPLLTSTTSPLSIGMLGSAHYSGDDCHRHCELF
jgi:hypothetical protein